MRSLGSRVSPSPSCSWKTLIPPCINPVAYKAQRKPNQVVENDVVLERCAPRFASHHERSAVWEVEAVYAALPSGKKAYIRLDQVQRLISRKGPREREVGLKKALPVPRPCWLRSGGATACGGRHAGRWEG